jgi:hypothetical protein
MLNNKGKSMQSDVQKNASFNDRQAAAAAAKQAMIERFRTRPSLNDPAAQARLADY